MKPHNINMIAGGAFSVNGHGRVVYVDDILDLLGHKKSRWWVRNHFAPQFKFKVGRSPVWFEADAMEWLSARRPS